MAGFTRFELPSFSILDTGATPSITITPESGWYTVIDNVTALCDQDAQEVTFKTAANVALAVPITIDQATISYDPKFLAFDVPCVVKLETPSASGSIMVSGYSVYGPLTTA